MKNRNWRPSGAEKVLAATCVLGALALAASTWTAKARAAKREDATIGTMPWKMAKPRARFASARVGNSWVLLGAVLSGRAARSDAEVFDLTASPWRRQFGVALPTPLLPRFDQTAGAVGSDVFIFGGMSGRQIVIGQGEKLNMTTGKVTAIAPMPTPRRMAHSVVANGKMYVVGGMNAAVKRVGTLEIYDTRTNTWSKAEAMKVGREADAVVWNGQIVVAGGYNGARIGDGVLKDVESYDLKTGHWRTMPSLSLPISAHHVSVAGDWLFLWGDYLTLSRVLAYNARTGQTKDLTQTGFLPRRHTETTVLENHVFVAGGNTSDVLAPLDDVQIFDAKQLVKMAAAIPKA